MRRMTLVPRQHVRTPAAVAEKLYDILYPFVPYGTILDPCVGWGALVEPWRATHEVIGYDIIKYNDSVERMDVRNMSWSDEPPGLVLMNPPFHIDENNGRIWPETFLREVVRVFGEKMKIVMITSDQFRGNLNNNSKRRKWLMESDLKITSIMSLSKDVWKDVEVRSEVICFNIPGLEAHYWL